MDKKLTIVITALMFAVTGSFLFEPAAVAQAQKPKITPVCKQCHAPDEKILRGTLGNVSQKAETIQIQTANATWLVRYGDNTKLTGAENLSRIPKEKEIAIAFTEKDGSLYADSVSVKQPAKVPAEKLIKVEEIVKLVAMGPDKGNFALVDSRPGPRYHEGHIPGATLIYDADFDKNAEKLPKDKDKLLIFYCGGVT